MMAETKTYILELKGGRQRKIEIPADWKVTFGPIAPGSRAHNGADAMALRIYESKEQQRAIFTDVVSFREAGIPILEKTVKVKQQRGTRSTKSGSKDVMLEARVTEWTDPDAPEEPDAEFTEQLTWRGDDEL